MDKAYDGTEAGINSLAMTAAETAPFMQLDLGSTRTDIAAVRIAASSDPTYSFTLANNLEVYISSGLDAKATGTLCGTIGAYTSAGQAQSVTCPSGASGRYITVFRTGLTTAASMAVQEISPLVVGECKHTWHKARVVAFDTLECFSPPFDTLNVFHLHLTP